MENKQQALNLEMFTSHKGRIAVVTGANTGLGFETALGLVKKDLKVVLACRDDEKAEAAKASILEQHAGADVETMSLDLSSFDSVRRFSYEFLEKFDSLDLLINNAGIMMTPFGKTEDGLESQMGVNYFGHFLLTGLLLPVINATKGSRIVALSSIAHRHGKIDFDNLNAEKSYSRIGAYAQSKLACLMFAYELQRRLDTAKSKTISVAAHPGASNTELGRHLPSLVQFVAPFLSFVTHSVESGARPTLLAALSAETKGGDYYGPTGFREMKGDPGKVNSTSASHDESVARRLWEESEKITGISTEL